VVILLGRKGEENTLINDYAGIGFQIPASGSFHDHLFPLHGRHSSSEWIYGQILYLQCSGEIKILLVVILGVLNSAVSVYYYLRVTVVMYFRNQNVRSRAFNFHPSVIALILAVIGTLYMGYSPPMLLSLAHDRLPG